MTQIENNILAAQFEELKAIVQRQKDELERLEQEKVSQRLQAETRQWNVQLPKIWIDYLKKKAKYDGITINDLARRIIGEYLRTEKPNDRPEPPDVSGWVEPPAIPSNSQQPTTKKRERTQEEWDWVGYKGGDAMNDARCIEIFRDTE